MAAFDSDRESLPKTIPTKHEGLSLLTYHNTLRQQETFTLRGECITWERHLRR